MQPLFLNIAVARAVVLIHKDICCGLADVEYVFHLFIARVQIVLPQEVNDALRSNQLCMILALRLCKLKHLAYCRWHLPHVADCFHSFSKESHYVCSEKAVNWIYNSVEGRS